MLLVRGRNSRQMLVKAYSIYKKYKKVGWFEIEIREKSGRDITLATLTLTWSLCKWATTFNKQTNQETHNAPGNRNFGWQLETPYLGMRVCGRAKRNHGLFDELGWFIALCMYGFFFSEHAVTSCTHGNKVWLFQKFNDV